MVFHIEWYELSEFCQKIDGANIKAQSLKKQKNTINFQDFFFDRKNAKNEATHRF